MGFSHTPLGLLRTQTGLSARAFSKLLRAAGVECSDQRLLRIENSQCVATCTEKQAIAKLLGKQSFELGI